MAYWAVGALVKLHVFQQKISAIHEKLILRNTSAIRYTTQSTQGLAILYNTCYNYRNSCVIMYMYVHVMYVTRCGDMLGEIIQNGVLHVHVCVKYIGQKSLDRKSANFKYTCTCMYI